MAENKFYKNKTIMSDGILELCSVFQLCCIYVGPFAHVQCILVWFELNSEIHYKLHVLAYAQNLSSFKRAKALLAGRAAERGSSIIPLL